MKRFLAFSLIVAFLTPLAIGQIQRPPQIQGGVYIRSEAVTDFHIQNMERTMDISHNVWLNATAAALTTSTTPSLGLWYARPAIWMATGVTSGTITTTIVIPADYASGGELEIATSNTNEASTVGGAFNLATSTVDPFGSTALSTSFVPEAAVDYVKSATFATTPHTLVLPIELQTGLAAGRALTLQVGRSSGQGDVVFYAIRFRYTAAR